MELLVFDSEFNGRGVLDVFNSLVWTDRFNKHGTVEIETSSIMEALAVVSEDCYLIFPKSEHIMLVDAFDIKTDEQAGNKLIIQGRSLESFLDRRIVWGQTILDGNFQDAVLQLLNENAINPTDPARKIPGLIFEATEDPAITTLNVKAQFGGENLYQAISDMCVSANIGFKITRNSDGEFVFRLYSGTDRSYSQFENPYVVFSPEFENFINGRYLHSKRLLKTVVLVAGEGEWSIRKTTTVSLNDGGGTGLNRREIFTDASSISQMTSEGGLSNEDYYAQLTQKGLETLAENMIDTAFEGQLQPNILYRYGEDFFMGDIVQIADEYGHESRVQIVEFFYVQDAGGEKMYPTLATVN